MKELEAVAGIIRYQGKILCMQRGNGKNAETAFKWEFPGGKIEPGETPRDAVSREIAEELGVQVEVGELLYTVEWDYPGFHLSMGCYVCRLLGGELQLREHTDFRWLGAGELNSAEWLPADVEVLPHVATLLK